MKSNFKRILALALVLCTVAAWMIPGVSAETPASLTVDFKTVFDNAEIPADKYLQNYPDALDAAYETNKITIIRDDEGTMVKPNATYAGGRVRGAKKYLEVAHNDISKYGGTAVLPFKFVAPGTGDYTLSFTYGKGYSKDNGGDEIGAYILAMPETPYDRYSIPMPDAENVLTKASLATPGVTGTVTAEDTVALVEGTEYIIVFYVIDDEKAYADFINFALEPVIVEEPEPEEPTPEEPEIEHKTDDMVVNFADYMATNGITGSSGNRFWSDGNAVGAMDNNYATTGWTVYRNEAGATVWTTYPPRFYETAKLQFYASKANTEAFAISKFVAPGTGDYKLSLSTGVVASADARADVAGAYIIPYGEYTKYNALTYVDKAGAVVLDAEQLSKVATYTAEESVSLVTGQEYLLVFFVKDSVDGKSKADFSGFSLTYQWPAAFIGDASYATLGEAMAAAKDNDTIKLGMDAVANEVELASGVTLDLNGKTLTANAVSGKIIDSADGKGLLAVDKEYAVITTAAGTVALWDNTEEASGYRVFAYKATNVGVSAGEDNATSVDAEIDFYDYERNFLAQSFDENGEVAKGAGDFRFVNVAGQIKADYDAGKTDWRLEYSNQQYQMGRGGVCFSWGNKSIRQFGAGYMAVRFWAPAEGKVSVILKTSSTGDATKDAGFSLYLLKASDVEALYNGDYEALVDTFVANPATAVADLNTAITTAYGATDPVLTGISNGEAYSANFEFEADEEYIAVFLNNGSVNGALTMNFQNLSFYRAEKHGATQTFVAGVKFANEEALNLVATGESGMKVGFTMAWNGAEKTFEYDAMTIAAWAQAELDNADKDYGFYIRMSGFEALTESGTLTGSAFVGDANAVAAAEGDLSYTYTIAE